MRDTVMEKLPAAARIWGRNEGDIDSFSRDNELALYCEGPKSKNSSPQAVWRGGLCMTSG